MEENTLKPCPFCGGTGRLIVIGQVEWVRCHTCGSRTRECGRYAEAPEYNAAALWNRRKGEAPGDQSPTRADLALAMLARWQITDEDVRRLENGGIARHDIAARFCVDAADALRRELAKPPR